MKNKKLIYLLLPLNIILWGYIGYSLYSSVKQPVNYKNSNLYSDNKVLLNGAPDTFKLLLNYRDPFTGRVGHSGKVNSDNIAKPAKPFILKKSQPKPEKSTLRWPEIQYHGMMKNPGTQKMTTIITINQSNYIMKPGEMRDSVTLVKVYKDSVLVKLQSESKFIIKQ